MELKFKSEAGSHYTYILAIGYALLLVSVIVMVLVLETKSFFPFIYVFPLAILTWVRLSTYYVITDGWLKVYGGPIRYKIAVGDINFIRLNQVPSGGLRKVSLAYRGIVIYYEEKRKSIYISPEHLDEFIAELKRINKNIEVREGVVKR